ncbi:hypothetical protein E2C01_059823 [Portunus trituberculatus]|uniref:Uncharacterized protein n=1 Tax=Portunus trituberculatus TaxID=210409 RepID=A0A5B7H8W0_PORTR|nr:hypothetical protein [Portunus trituberculatus]
MEGIAVEYPGVIYRDSPASEHLQESFFPRFSRAASGAITGLSAPCVIDNVARYNQEHYAIPTHCSRSSGIQGVTGAKTRTNICAFVSPVQGFARTSQRMKSYPSATSKNYTFHQH